MKNAKQLKSHMDDVWIEDMLIYGLRYTIGRSSYSPSVAMDFMTPLIPYLTMKSLVVISRDVEEHLSYEESSETKYKDYHINQWTEFKSKVDKEIKKRSENECL